jgi:UDP-N-acetylmuramoyl-tripeptide--D-alanyl-D-alanine ligase
VVEPLWTSEEITQAVGGRGSGASFVATGVSIDTRSLNPGDLFIALAGERDGHAFVAQAQAKGASGVLVSQPTVGEAIQVDDTQAALERLGLAARDRAPRARRGAVTGSASPRPSPGPWLWPARPTPRSSPTTTISACR